MMGIPIDEIASAYEANIIAATYPHENRNDVYKGVYNDQGLHSFPYNIYCHYAVPPVQMDHRTIGSITSKDCIADFSFGDPLESVLKYLKSKLGGVLPPYISHLQKPYETEKDSGKFLNKEIQARWDTVVAKTGLPKQAESTS
jgi:hypothetical protein